MSWDDFNHAGFLQWLATDIILLPNPEPTEFSVVAPVDTVATVNGIPFWQRGLLALPGRLPTLDAPPNLRFPGHVRMRGKAPNQVRK